MSIWRWNLHAAVTALAISPVALGWTWGFPLPFVNHEARPVTVEVTEQTVLPPGLVEDLRAAVSAPAPEDAADVVAADDRPLIAQVVTYRVRRGDTLNEIAKQSGISTDTVLWANTLWNPNRILPGQELTLLPVDGVLAVARDGDTVEAIADRYATSASRLIRANGLAEPYALRTGDRLLVPGGRPVAAATISFTTTEPTATLGAAGQRSIAWPVPGTGDRNKRQFIEAAAAAARESQRRTRVPVSVIIAQAIHESYWGTSKLAREANNYFGIKARNGAGSAGVYWMDAWEVENGVDVVVPEPFRAYQSPDDSLLDHGKFFIENRRYHSAFAVADDPRAFARAIAVAGYATDPDYAPKLIGIMEQYNLFQYDLP